MTAFRHWLATLSVFAFGGVTQSYVQPAEAATAAQVSAACERALAANTIDALEDFLHKYPPGSSGVGGAACYALALDALNSFNGRDGSNNGGRQNGGDGGYGS